MNSTQMLAQAAGLLVWYNAVFVVLFGFGFLFTLLQLIGMGHGAGADADTDVDADADMDAHLDADAHVDVDTDMDAHVDVDADADVDVDADAHVDVDADGDVDADAHAEVDTHAEAGGHSIGVGSTLAQLLALGKVPVSMSLMLLCYTTGITGWIANNVLESRFADPAKFFPLSLLVALVAAFGALRIVGSLMSRYLPSVATSAMPKRRLIGMTAKAVLPVNERFGQATLYDPHGTLHVVGCRVRAGAPNIEKGAKVVLVKYIPDRDLFEVGRA